MQPKALPTPATLDGDRLKLVALDHAYTAAPVVIDDIQQRCRLRTRELASQLGTGPDWSRLAVSPPQEMKKIPRKGKLLDKLEQKSHFKELSLPSDSPENFMLE